MLLFVVSFGHHYHQVVSMVIDMEGLLCNISDPIGVVLQSSLTFLVP